MVQRKEIVCLGLRRRRELSAEEAQESPVVKQSSVKWTVVYIAFVYLFEESEIPFEVLSDWWEERVSMSTYMDSPAPHHYQWHQLGCGDRLLTGPLSL